MVLSVTFTLRASLRNVGSFCNAVWICPCKVAVSFKPTPVVPEAVLPATELAPAFVPIEPVLAPVGFVVEGFAAAVPVTPPEVAGVLVAI